MTPGIIINSYTVYLLIITVLAAVSGVLLHLTWKRAYAAGVKSGYDKRENEEYKIIREEISRHRESEDYKNVLENSYLKGRLDGAREELERFTINYEPFIDIYDSYFRKTFEAGYQVQIFYNGIPVGDPTRRVVRHREKFKEENVKLLMEQVNSAIGTIAQSVASKGIPVKTSQTPVKSKAE